MLNRSSGSGTSQTDKRNLLTDRTSRTIRSTSFHRQTQKQTDLVTQNVLSQINLRFLWNVQVTSPELAVGLADVLVQDSDVVSVSVEVLVSGGVLQHAGDGAQDMALLRLQVGAGRAVHHVETVRSHDGWVHVAVIDQVPHNLKGKMTNGSTELFLRFCSVLLSQRIKEKNHGNPVFSR